CRYLFVADGDGHTGAAIHVRATAGDPHLGRFHRHRMPAQLWLLLNSQRTQTEEVAFLAASSGTSPRGQGGDGQAGRQRYKLTVKSELDHAMPVSRQVSLQRDR